MDDDYYLNRPISSMGDTRKLMHGDTYQTQSLMLKLPCHVRCKIRDNVVRLHRLEVVDEAVRDLWLEMRYFNRWYGASFADVESAPKAAVLLKRFKDLSRINGVDEAITGFREYTKRMVTANLVSNIAFVSWANFQPSIKSERENVHAKRRLLVSAVIGHYPVVELNEQNVPVFEDAND